MTGLTIGDQSKKGHQTKARKFSDKIVVCLLLMLNSIILPIAHAPKLTFSPACPFNPWDQSQQTQWHAKRCEGMGETQEREEPVLFMKTVQSMQHPGIMKKGMVTELRRPTTCIS